jgi:hypothetical protein
MRHVICLAFAVLLAMSPAAADDGSDHDHEHTPQFGGVVVESGHHQMEVVAGDGTIALHIGGEHGNAETVAGAAATAAVLSGGKKVDVELKPDGGTVLKGSGPFKAGKGTTIVITLRMPDHDPEQVRVTLD